MMARINPLRALFPALISLVLFAGALSPMTGGKVLAGDSPTDPGPEKPNPIPGRSSRPMPLREMTSGAASAPANSDSFGYVVDDNATYQWVDATSGTQVIFSGPDDSSFGPVNLGFSFKFYENSYSQVYVNTNGLLTFQDQSASFNNAVIPRDSPPNDLIAAFWDDLVVGGSFNAGKVYYKTGQQGSLKYLAVAWVNVTRLGSSDTLTFEILLYENGDIKLQYKDLGGVLNRATVGIEDGDGVDGLLYLHQSPGLSNGLAVLFDRPPKDFRVKTIPSSLDGLVVKGEAQFTLAVRNTGEKGQDRYNLTVSPATNWQVRLFGVGGAPLSDTNGDGKVDTGPIVQGATYTVTIKVTPPNQVATGDFKQLSLTAASSGNPAKKATVPLTAAVPVSFAQAYADGQVGMNLDLVWEHKWGTAAIKPGFNGSSLAMVASEDGSFFYAWERIGIGPGGQFANLELASVDQYGEVLLPPFELTDNSLDTLQTTDRFPSLAAAPSGNLGVVWVRNRLNLSTLKTNSNIYFAVLNAQGAVLHGPQNLTVSSAWRGDGDLNIPSYSSPRIAATGDGRFHLAWVNGQVKAGGETSDLEYAVYKSADGSAVKGPHALTFGVPGGKRFLDPALIALLDNRVVMVYSVLDPGPVDYTLARQVKSSTGTTLSGHTAMPTLTGWGPDGVQLLSGHIALAWTDPVTMQIVWAILDSSSLGVLHAPQALANSDGRPADYVSVTVADGDRSVLTWMDASFNQRLYYAVIAGDGLVETPPVLFKQGVGSQALILSSYAGQGTAPFAGAWYSQFLPVTQR